jgi:hypothetical protein
MTNTDAKNQQYIEMSYAFIKDHPDAFSNEIPEKLLEFWMLDNESEEDEPTEPPAEDDPEWTVFMHAFILYKKNTGVQEFTISPEELEEQFNVWQFTLQTAYISNTTDVKLKPFPVFRFDENKDMKIEFLE